MSSIKYILAALGDAWSSIRGIDKCQAHLLSYHYSNKCRTPF